MLPLELDAEIADSVHDKTLIQWFSNLLHNFDVTSVVPDFYPIIKSIILISCQFFIQQFIASFLSNNSIEQFIASLCHTNCIILMSS